MDFNIDTEHILKLVLSFLVGMTIGFEREYQSKSAGLRTMIMICLGSTIFTLVSSDAFADSRIAANILTGVGFIGAGVIFKDGLSVSGLTTSSTIWICAALGMAIGAGEYGIAMIGFCVVILSLTALQRLAAVIEHLHQSRNYRISYRGDDFKKSLKDEVDRLKLKPKKNRELKEKDFLVIVYEVSGREKKLDDLNSFLKSDGRVISYEY